MSKQGLIFAIAKEKCEKNSGLHVGFGTCAIADVSSVSPSSEQNFLGDCGWQS